MRAAPWTCRIVDGGTEFPDRVSDRRAGGHAQRGGDLVWQRPNRGSQGVEDVSHRTGWTIVAIEANLVGCDRIGDPAKEGRLEIRVGDLGGQLGLDRERTRRGLGHARLSECMHQGLEAHGEVTDPVVQAAVRAVVLLQRAQVLDRLLESGDMVHL